MIIRGLHFEGRACVGSACGTAARRGWPSICVLTSPRSLHQVRLFGNVRPF